METLSIARARLRHRPPTGRPFVYLNAALSADGKLAPPDRRFVPFGSARDHAHLYELRTTADAVLAGARTVDATAVTMTTGGAEYERRRLRLGLKRPLVRVIVTGGGTVNPAAEIFRHRTTPLILLTTGRTRPKQMVILRGLADEVQVFGDDQLDFAAALGWLRREWGVRRLLGEGGGEVNAALLAAGLVDEIHVTLCPVLFGGFKAPTLADGDGFATLAAAARLKLQARRRVGDEMLLTYRVLKPGPASAGPKVPK